MCLRDSKVEIRRIIKKWNSNQAVFRESNVAGNDVVSPLSTSGVNVCIG
jgi:hypothetical protein